MNYKKISIALLLTCFIVLGTAVISHAQILPPPPPDSSAPLDPLSWLLLGAGGIFAGKKYYDTKKTKK